MPVKRPVTDDSRKRRVTLAGAGANLALAGVKFAAGFFTSSAVLIADAVHSLSDLATDVLVFVGVRISGRPADENHPWGHGRIETLVAFIIGLLLIAAALGLAREGLEGIGSPQAIRSGGLAIAAAGLSLVVKELLFRWTRAVGRRTGSQALMANAWHHRTDALSSLVALCAVLGALLFPDWPFLDALGSLLVALLVLVAGVKIAFQAARELVDTGVERELSERLTALAAEVGGVRAVEKLNARRLGSSLAIDLTIAVDPEMNVFEAHRITDFLDSAIRRRHPRVERLMIHVEPLGTALELDGRRNSELRQAIQRACESVPGVRGLHYQRLYRRPDGVLVELEIGLDAELPLSEAHRISDEVSRLVRALPDIREVLVHLEPL